MRIGTNATAVLRSPGNARTPSRTLRRFRFYLRLCADAWREARAMQRAAHERWPFIEP